MGKIIQSITEQNQFEESFNKYFIKGDSYIKKGKINISVEYKGYIDGQVVLMIPEEITGKQAILFTINNNLMIFSKMEFVLKKEDNVYLFKPSQLQIMELPRKEERKEVNGQAGNDQKMYISNIISDFTILECFKSNRKQIEIIKAMMLDKIQKFKVSNIFLLGDKGRDPRMKYFFSEKSPIYVPDINDEEFQKKRSKFYKFYKTSIFESDRDIDWMNIKSELSIPLIYKLMIPFGYLQINHTEKISKEEESAIRKMGITFSDVFSKNEIIKTSDEKILVTDLSKNGLGIVFQERRLIKHFKDGSYLFFNIFLPDKKTISVYCIVRNINLIKNKIFKIGCEIIEMDALGETYYDDLLSG